MNASGCLQARSGFTLIELLFVLVLGITVVAVATIGVSRALESSKVRNEARNISELISAAQSLRSSDGYPNEMIGLLRAMRRLPPAFADPGGSYLIHAWSGSLRLRSIGEAGFELVLEDMPGGACTSLAALVAKSDQITVFVGSTRLGSSDAKHLVTQAGALCGQGDTSTVSLIYNN